MLPLCFRIASLIMRRSTSESALASVTFFNGTISERPVFVVPSTATEPVGTAGTPTRRSSGERSSGVIQVSFSVRATTR